MNKYSKIAAFILLAYLFFGCTDKFDSSIISSLSEIQGPPNISDTLYILQSPVWGGFNKPQAMIVGRDNFLYIADTDNNRIVMMDVAGQMLGAKQVKHPVAIAQDHRLNLIVCAQLDTVIEGNSVTYSAVYKIDMFAAGHLIETAPVKRILPATSFDLLRPDREYTGVTVFYDNSYFVSRKGSQNTSRIDPDNAILSFKVLNRNGIRKDTLTGKLPLFEPVGTGLPSAYNLSSLSSTNFQGFDIVTTLETNSFKVQYLEYVQTNDFEGYRSKLAVGTDLLTPNKFGKPEGTTFDNANNLFIADAAKDSVFKFNSFGDELQSFGGGELFDGLPLDGPSDVAFFDRTLYLVDTNNNRILRFILSTEID